MNRRHRSTRFQKGRDLKTAPFTAGWQTHAYGKDPEPLYRRLKCYIEQQIGCGAWPPGTRIPSEMSLVEYLGISRMTVHRALRELAAEGRLVRVQGVGTFVSQPKPLAGFLQIKSIAEEIRENGGRHGSQTLLLQQEDAPAAIARTLGLAEKAPVYHSVIVHTDRGCPIQYAERWVNPAVAPEYLQQDFTLETPSEYLCRIAPVTEVEHVVEALLPDKRIRALLQIGPREPCLVLHRVTWSRDRVATTNRFVYPGSRYRIGGRFKFAPSDRPIVA
jgi:GntR family histidine utilization transcriptional repressor